MTDAPNVQAHPVHPPNPCEHMNFEANVSVGRITEVEGGPVKSYMAEVTVKCVQCGAFMLWQGLPAGYSHHAPHVSADGIELRAPMQPRGGRPPAHWRGFVVKTEDGRTGIEYERPAPGTEGMDVVEGDQS